MKYFSEDSSSAFDAKAAAQRLVFGPVAFQACCVLKHRGLLELVRKSGKGGISLEELSGTSGLSDYAIKVLMEAGLGMGLFFLKDNRYVLTKVGFFILHDLMTQVNMDFVEHLCYNAMPFLDASLVAGAPEGLKALGPWPTLYQGLSHLPEKVRSSWLEWDHYYSDRAFPEALDKVMASRPRRILDIGGNTGKWAIQCVKRDPEVRVTMVDLPEQIEWARKIIGDQGFLDRIDFFPVDFLKQPAPLPEAYDAIWMSQFLDCFSLPQITAILSHVMASMSEQTSLWILDLFWDRQPNAAAAFCLQQISLYFTCLANGNSQMYRSTDVLGCVTKVGLELVDEYDQVGAFHTLLHCRLPSDGMS